MAERKWFDALVTQAGSSRGPAAPASKVSPWSDGLQQQTRAAIEDVSVAPDGLLHMKHKVLGFAAMDALELLQGKLVCRNKGGASWEYPDVQSLVAAGWAID